MKTLKLEGKKEIRDASNNTVIDSIEFAEESEEELKRQADLGDPTAIEKLKQLGKREQKSVEKELKQLKEGWDEVKNSELPLSYRLVNNNSGEIVREAESENSPYIHE